MKQRQPGDGRPTMVPDTGPASPAHAVEPSPGQATAGQPTRPTDADRHLPRHSGWRIGKNTIALALGSNVNALGRLVVLAMIVRASGAIVFGWFALIIEIIKLAEGLVDFGTTEVFVRDINRDPSRRSHLLRVLTMTKTVQVPVAFGMLVAVLLAMGYPVDVVQAGLVGGATVVSFAGVLIYRVIFRADLDMEREIFAELVSVVVLIALVARFGGKGVSLTTLLACYLVARVVFSLLCIVLGRRRYLPSGHGVSVRQVVTALRRASVIGVAGFVVVIYASLELLMLSRLAGELDVAYYSAAQKLAWPVLMALAAIGSTLYSVVSASWSKGSAHVQAACQRGLDSTFLLGALACCALVSAPVVFLRLIGPEVVAAAPALQILTVLSLVKAVSMTIGPTLFVIRAEKHILALIAVAAVVKAALVFAVAPAFGFIGAALASLVVETLVVVPGAVVLVRRLAGIRLTWGRSAAAALTAVAAVLAAAVVAPGGGLAAAAIACALYLLIIFSTRVVRLTELLPLLPGGISRRR